MKYWRGYLTAAILAAITVAVTAFAENHRAIVDMVYPYASRLIQTTLADWTAAMDFCLWQVLAVLLIAALLTSIVLVILFRWNIFQWLGWVLTGVSLLWLLQTGLFGLNRYAGPLADDIRLKTTSFNVTELISATTYFRDQANALSQQVSREEDGSVAFADFDALADTAGDGFVALTYDRSFSVFAGSTAPVKKLSWTSLYSSMGVDGVTVAFTGESAVNPDYPAMGLPFVMCREMARRMCIAAPEDANFAAYLACTANEDLSFRYCGYFMAFRYCYTALNSVGTSTADNAAQAVFAGASDALKQDLQHYNTQLTAFYGGAEAPMDNATLGKVCDLLVSWYVQDIYLPEHQDEEEGFNPLDKNQVDLEAGTSGS